MNCIVLMSINLGTPIPSLYGKCNNGIDGFLFFKFFFLQIFCDNVNYISVGCQTNEQIILFQFVVGQHIRENMQVFGVNKMNHLGVSFKVLVTTTTIFLLLHLTIFYYCCKNGIRQTTTTTIVIGILQTF